MRTPEKRGRYRRNLAGAALFATVALTVLQALLPALSQLAAGLSAWFAGMLLWPDIAGRSRRQAVVLLALGALGFVWGWEQGIAPDWDRAFASNATLISMLAAVSFLRLITVPREAATRLPTGTAAIRSTLLGLHLFGAVVNLSTLFIMARRMAPEGVPDSRQLRLLTRGFSAAAFWSPFFAAMAVALTFAPGAELGTLLLAGLPLAAVALTVTENELSREQPESFRGYPMSYESLWLPGVLALFILALHGLRSELSVLVIISLLAPALTALVLPLQGRPMRAFTREITTGLPRMGNELTLFLAAGFLAAGLQAALASYGWVPLAHYGGPQACGVLLLIVVLALAGVHPVISIATLGSLLVPVHPDPNLLAMTFLAGWAVGVSISPLSGMNLALQGLYGFSGWQILRWNIGYAAKMMVAAWAVLLGYGWLAAVV